MPPASALPDPGKGTVVFSTGQGQTSPATLPDVFPKLPVTTAERTAVEVASCDLDLHLTPAEQRAEGHAVLMLRNVSDKPLARIPIQVTSTLRWSSFSAEGKGLAFTQSPITTDADHTGYAQEAVLTLQQPLAAGATLVVSAFYSGQIPASTARLELVGTPVEKAAEADWDQIAGTSDEGTTALRGFGQVLWYPVTAPTALLGEGNQLFDVISQQKLRNERATMRLRLAVVYVGDPPNAAILNGRLYPLTRTPDEVNQVVDETHGVATGELPLAPIGFRTPSLFLTAQEPTDVGALLSVISPVPEAAEPYAAAAAALQPMFRDWLGPDPLAPLILMEHAGLPYEDGGFIAAHLSASARPEGIAPELVRGLTHAWFNAPAPENQWLEQGMPEFMSLLWTERTLGRDTALLQLQHNALPMALASPDLTAPEAVNTGTPLVRAASDVDLRLKSAAVLWQLRDIVGEEAFRKGLKTYRASLVLNQQAAAAQDGFEKALEKASGKDLGWFFEDWVYRDRGLPDLTVTQINPRPVPAKGGVSNGYLVAVEVRNDGFAAAEIPIAVSSGTTLSASVRLRVPARSSAATRILFEGTPETLQVGDGGVPELRSSVHRLAVKIAAASPVAGHP